MRQGLLAGQCRCGRQLRSHKKQCFIQGSRDQPSAHALMKYMPLHGAAVTSPSTRVGASQGMVVAVRSVAQSVTVFEGDGAGVACADNRQPSQDRGCRNHVHDLLSRKRIMDQPRAALRNPRLCTPLCSDMPQHVLVNILLIFVNEC